MKKIILISFYFGKAPWYINYFIQSCLLNKDVDFIFFTDIEGIEVVDGSNFRIINTSFNDFKEVVAKEFDFELSVNSPIKLCDIRPSFGEIFKEILLDYDFWGYCDIDIIFGRIRYFVDEETLNNYDVIFSKHEYPSGFFALYRNNDSINKLYRSSDFKKTFQNSALLLFDECGGYYDEVCSGINILNTDYEIDSMHHILEKNKDKVNVLYEFLSIEASPGEIKYTNGLLSYRDEFEILLYHLTNFKKNFFFKENLQLRVGDYRNYYIGEYRISRLNKLSILYNKTYCSAYSFLKKLYLKTDYRFNKKIAKYRYCLLKTGGYQYMKRNFIIVKQNDDYYISYSDKIKYKIHFLIFNKEMFYIKELNLYYKIEGLKDNIFTISKIFSDGSIMEYKSIQ